MTASTATLNLRNLLSTAQQHQAYAEQAGQLHPDVWEQLHASGISAATLPAELGGRPITPPDLITAITRIAEVDAATGWAAAIHGPAGIFTALLPPAAAARIHPAEPDGRLLIGGSSQPAGTAHQTTDGYVLNGTWPLVSGAHRLDVGFLAARTFAGDASEQGVRWWCVPGSALTVHDDWDAHGLRGSDSASVTVTDLLLPADQNIDLTAPQTGNGINSPLDRFPRYGLLACTLAAVAVGVAARAQQAFLDLALQPRHGGRPADASDTRIVYARSRGRLAAAGGYLTTAVESTWTQVLNGPASTDQRAQLRLAAVEATQTATAVVRDLFDAAGAAAVYRANGLSVCVRDLDVIARHALLGTPTLLKTGGYQLTGHTPKDL
jgi:alkylation response protein AidB-like acyl-CoA dehydrogenase